jgi:peptide deformylase
MSIVKYGAAILRVKAKTVTSFGAELADIVKQMKAKLAEASGVGLAATQVALDMALFIARLGEKLYVFVNPAITPLSKKTYKDEEGCLSVPGVWVEVERYEHIKLSAQDETGKEVFYELEGYPARVIQHEVDHLNGVLIVDRISPRKRREIAPMLEELEHSTNNGG